MENRPLVSIIVPTRNSEKALHRCLESIKNQTYKNIEPIIVDNYSLDRTIEIAKKFGVKVLLRNLNRSEARNMGAEKSAGEFVLFIDSDMELSPEVVESCVSQTNRRYDAVIIPEISVGDGFWAKCKALERACYIGDDWIEAARFFKREAFETVQGYDPNLEAGEDWDLSQRIRKAGFKIGRTDPLIIHHEGKLDFRKTIMKKYEYGRTLERYIRKHPERAKQQLRLIRPAFLRNRKMLLNDPVHTIGLFIMKTCEFAAGVLGSICRKKKWMPNDSKAD
jgi:glycosyltransferase involved in cell wall biosynthesis